MQEIDKSSLVQFGNIEILAKQIVEGFITGLHKSPFHGFSVEFAEHRLYNKGESTRNIDWKLYGRTEKLFVKKYEEETNLRCQIVLDCSSSMFFPDQKKANQFNKLEFSVIAAASLIELLKRQRDAIGLTLFSNEIDLHTKAKSSNSHHRMVLHQMEKIIREKKIGKKSLVVDSLHNIAEIIHQRSMVFIFSDMMDSDENNSEIMQALQHLRHRKHEVVLFHIYDKKLEYDFDFDNRPYKLVDFETGEFLKLSPNQIKKNYQSQISKWYNDLRLKCGQIKIDFVPVNIRESLELILVQYLLKRQKTIR